MFYQSYFTDMDYLLFQGELPIAIVQEHVSNGLSRVLQDMGYFFGPSLTMPDGARQRCG